MSHEPDPTTKFPSAPPSGFQVPPTASPPEVTSGSVSALAPARLPQHSIPPEDLHKLAENYAANAPEGTSPDGSIQGIITDLEAWTSSISRAQKVDRIRFWSLKGLSFFGAVGTTALGTQGLIPFAVAAGVITAIAIAVDAAWPSSGDENARKRAIVELRELQHTVKLKWEKVKLAHPDPTALKRVAHALALVDSVNNKREQVGTYLGDASPPPSD